MSLANEAPQNFEHHDVRFDREWLEVRSRTEGYYPAGCAVDRSVGIGNLYICGEDTRTNVRFGPADLMSGGLSSSGVRRSGLEECAATFDRREEGVWGSVGAIAMYPPETRLVDLPAASERILRAAQRLPRASPTASYPACWLTSPTARVTNVNEYVNLRRQPDFSARVIRRVPLGEQVRPLRYDNITVVGQERDRQSCIRACQAFRASQGDQAARDRVQECIEGNSVWYEITDARGNRGWVSRKFLEELE